MVEHEKLLVETHKLFKNNHRTGKKDNLEFNYTCPSPIHYSQQWLWDSSFHSIVLTHLDEERAKNEIKTLLSKQDSDGFVPCVAMWQKNNFWEYLFYKTYSRNGKTTLTQPPVVSHAVQRIYEKTGDKKFLSESFPKIESFINWLSENRDKNRNGLIEIIHPWEAGCDSIPSFDTQLNLKTKPGVIETFYKLLELTLKYQRLGWDEEKIFKSKLFISESVLYNSIYIQALESLAVMAEALGQKEKSLQFREKSKKTLYQLIKYSWSEEDNFFYDLDSDGKQVKVKTVSGLMPLISSNLNKSLSKPLIEKHLLNKDEFWSDYPIPSVAMDEKTFNPLGNLVLWRGPTWVNTNWFISKALALHGYEKHADTLSKKTKEMVMKNGFKEFYNPLTGEGYGQPDFGWSTLVVDM